MNNGEDFRATLPTIPRDQVQFLDYDTWYDGPLSGLCRVGNDKFYYFLIDSDRIKIAAEQGPCKLIFRDFYTLHRLPTEQIQDYERWKKLFDTEVGNCTHWSHDGGVCSLVEQPQWRVDRFYKDYEARSPRYVYRDNPAVGYFVEESGMFDCCDA